MTRPRRRKLAALPLLLALGACDSGLLDTPTPPADGGEQRVLGVVEVTLSGIGTSQMTATARLVRAALDNLRAVAAERLEKDAEAEAKVVDVLARAAQELRRA